MLLTTAVSHLMRAVIDSRRRVLHFRTTGTHLVRRVQQVEVEGIAIQVRWSLLQVDGARLQASGARLQAESTALKASGNALKASGNAFSIARSSLCATGIAPIGQR